MYFHTWKTANAAPLLPTGQSATFKNFLRHFSLINGLAMSQLNVPDEDHIVRYVGWNQVAKDANDTVRGILAEAFRLRPDEDGLSVNWLERADADAEHKLKRTVELLTAGITVGKKSRVAVSNVFAFKTICAARNARVRIVHIPEDGNEPHSEVRQLSRDDVELLELLASEAVAAHYLCLDVLA